MIRHLEELSKPAQRAILNSGITTLEELAAFSEKEVAQWHGIGPNALITIHAIFMENGL
jgi:DNA repair protein RadC